MEFITSKKPELPKTPEGLANTWWFNMWAKKYWPYKELEQGDTLYWYESASKCVVWRSRVVEVLRFPYESKEEVKQKLELKPPKDTQPYLVKAPDSGFCLAYEVEAIERVSFAKPEKFQFPRLGWLKLTTDVLDDWPDLKT